MKLLSNILTIWVILQSAALTAGHPTPKTKPTLKHSIKNDVFYKPLQNANHNIRSNILSQATKASAMALGSLGLMLQNQFNEMSVVNAAMEPEIKTLTRDDVGFINLNETFPKVTDIAWLDLQIGESDPQRVEISLFGEVCPKTCENFKLLCTSANGYGYKGSNIFRVISQFSVQGGNIGNDASVIPSKLSKFGKSAINEGNPFPQENFRILHSYETAGVVSMMKDLTNKSYQDSRFFITVAPYASWADDKYTAFGIVSKGMNFITGLTIVPVEAPANYPKSTIRIIDAGCYSSSSGSSGSSSR